MPIPIMTPIASNVSPKMPGQKKIRHRRIGSAGNGNQFAAYPQMQKSSPVRDRRSQSEPMELRKIKLVHTETQTDLMDISSADCTPSPCLASRDLSTSLRESPSPPMQSTIILAHKVSTRNYCKTEQQQSQDEEQEQQQSERYEATTQATSPNNGNALVESIDTADALTNSDITYHDACSSPDEQLINDAMNSNERLDIRECSDDDNLERLGRKVTELLNENRLSLQSENGNSTTLGEGSLLFDVMAARRGLISVNGDEVTIISRGNYANGNVKAMNNYNDIKQNIMVSSLSDQDYDEDEGDDDDCDDSWTDEEGEDTDRNYSLRRRR